MDCRSPLGRRDEHVSSQPAHKGRDIRDLRIGQAGGKRRHGAVTIPVAGGVGSGKTSSNALPLISRSNSTGLGTAGQQAGRAHRAPEPAAGRDAGAR